MRGHAFARKRAAHVRLERAAPRDRPHAGPLLVEVTDLDGEHVSRLHDAPEAGRAPSAAASRGNDTSKR